DTVLMMKEFKPDASLTIKGVSSQDFDLEVRDRRSGAVYPRYKQLESLSISFQLIDHRTNKITWSGTAELRMKSEGMVVSGKEFATGLISQLRADGVLMDCRQ
ncbi:hypothetical protein, partial [Bacillus cereus]|uniref:hypothetical protein n=1 Tax=Bacillus cereus TaxID=1396 RepID=UPI0039E0DE40